MNKPRWDTEVGRQMWLEGKKDSEIADEFGIKTSVVTTYRKRNWEGMLEKGTLKAMREAAAQELPAPAQIVEAKIDGDNPLVTPMGVTAPLTQGSQGGALAGMTPVPAAALVESGSKKKEARPQKPVDSGKRKIGVMEVMAAATEHLSGMKAVCTAGALQALWFWRNPEDLRRAKMHIDYLLQLLEEDMADGKQ